MIATNRFTRTATHLNRWSLGWIEQSIDKGIARIEDSQHDSGQKSCLKQRAHRYNSRFAQIGQSIGTARSSRPHFLRTRIQIARQSTQKNDDNGWWNNLSQGSRGRDDPGGQLWRVAIAQHRGQAQQAHGHNRGPHNPRRGCQKCPHDHNRDRQTSRQRAKHPRHSCQQIIGNL